MYKSFNLRCPRCETIETRLVEYDSEKKIILENLECCSCGTSLLIYPCRTPKHLSWSSWNDHNRVG